MDVVTSEGVTVRPGFRYPHAEASFVDGQWWVILLGDEQPVIPANVREDPESAGRKRLPSTPRTILEDLRLVAAMPDQETAATHLRDHVRMFMAPDLCKHGRPMFHRDREDAPFSCRTGGPAGNLTTGLSVGDVIRMINGLDAMRDLYESVAVRRQSASKRVVDDILSWPTLDAGLEGLIRAHITSAGLPAKHGRQLFSWTVNQAMEDSAAAVRIGWDPNRSPDFRLVTETTTGLYLAETLARLGLEDKQYKCSVCGLSFVRNRAPRFGDVLYCNRQDCQRERARVNQQRFRDRRREKTP
jgi:hypothetical protein